MEFSGIMVAFHWTTFECNWIIKGNSDGEIWGYELLGCFWKWGRKAQGCRSILDAYHLPVD
jgi:hypothetical protein